MKLNLLESAKDRKYVMESESRGAINLVDMLMKYGQVVDYMTEEMVANFYNVNNKTIEQIANRNCDELNKYGYKVYKKNEILNLHLVGLENIPNRGLRLYPIKAVIIVGMMLTESFIAEQLRSDIINKLFGNTLEISPKDRAILNIVNAPDGASMGVAIREYTDIITKPLLPKVNWFDEFMNGTGTYTSTQVAKVLHISSARKLNQILYDKGIIYKKGDNWFPYATTDDTWYKIIVGGNENYSYSQLKFTPKGLYEISKLLDISFGEEDLNLA